ncbi:hypothetical protein BST81_15045 [Leptolyngbya sp. 'hensonii']|uniref:hypothetical protein n=1 Tax=Leptolyngbya sp. 'hensonii' TaxID=1922337 RepID=UPI00094F5E03|nr:hypothetical protein [Leptolyngbya sp. 'hensonii']OLP17638.1 hypothetical protein BST81_15045 [Leptolyngbya sp. 'hensonii']
MIIPAWAAPGRTIVELSSTQSRRSGTVVGWEAMADRPGLFPLVRWSNPVYGVSFANPDWIEPPSAFHAWGSGITPELIQVGSRVQLLYPDHILGSHGATVIDRCDDAAEVMDHRGHVMVYPLTELKACQESVWQRLSA